MYFDAITIAAVRDEVQTLLVGGRVERVILPADLTVALEIYARGAKRWLLASADPQRARVYISPQRLARTSDEVSPLLLLMRKYVRDGRLAGVEQTPWERVLSLQIEKRDDEGTLQNCRLIIEVMGRHSNIVLVNGDGRVMESVKRVRPEMSRYRTVLPRQPYIPPPPQTKANPSRLARGELQQLCAGARPGTALSKALVDALAGFSPLVAREIAFRATGSIASTVDGVSWQAVEQSTAELVADVDACRWAPCLAREAGAAAAFAAYELRQFPDRMAVDSISAALDEYYANYTVPTRRGETGKATLRRTIDSLRDRATRRRESLRAALPDPRGTDRLRRFGELLLAYSTQIAPGQGQFDADGEQIELDPQLTAVENAHRYFREYQKAKAAAVEVPQLLERAEADLAFVEQAMTDLDNAYRPAEIDLVRQELIAAGLTKDPAAGKKKRRPPAVPLLKAVNSKDGFEILIGRSARQNERVTFELGVGGDTWVHARGVPGAHVLVKARGGAVSEQAIQEAAAYAAYYSGARGENKVAVDYTSQRHVRRIKGAPPGLVTYTNERTLQVRPAPPPGEE